MIAAGGVRRVADLRAVLVAVREARGLTVNVAAEALGDTAVAVVVVVAAGVVVVVVVAAVVLVVDDDSDDSVGLGDEAPRRGAAWRIYPHDHALHGVVL